MASNTSNPLPMRPTPHPVLPWFSQEQINRLALEPDGAERFTAAFTARETLIRNSMVDPLTYGFEFDNWARADEMVQRYRYIYVSGGKRAAKSEWAAKRTVQAALRYGNGKIWCFQGHETTSIQEQQPLIWKYLPPSIRSLNDKKHPVFKIKYQEGRGFTEMFLVLPNRTKIFFLTAKQDPTNFQGWKLGSSEGRDQMDNIGVWWDEDMPLIWWDGLQMRLSDFGAKVIWTFSPVWGVTPMIKHFRGAPRVVETRPSELLPDRVNVPNCPAGHMPFIEEPSTNGAVIIYFFSQENKFGNYADIKARLKDKPSEQIMRDAYGYAHDVIGRAFPKFSGVNVMKATQLPERGTNFRVFDPHGTRNGFLQWWRVTDENPPRLICYREWPSLREYGEWAKPSQNAEWFDGDPGPAQKSVGYGVINYKKLILEKERIRGSTGERDAYRLKLAAELDRARQFADATEAPVKEVSELIFLSLIDPRAAKNEHISEQGGTCLLDQFADEQRDANGQVVGAPMLFQQGSGVDIEEKVSEINRWLYWDEYAALSWPDNAPHLYVSEECGNTIWALENWTGRDGSRGACKDPVDCTALIVMENPTHISAAMMQTRGGGSY